MTSCSARDHVQDHRGIHCCLLAGLQLGKTLHVGVKTLPYLFDGGFFVEWSRHKLRAAMRSSLVAGSYRDGGPENRKCKCLSQLPADNAGHETVGQAARALLRVSRPLG